jgi:hypothetical protein
LPAALGAAATRPNIPVVDIDGDGSFVMNIQVTEAIDFVGFLYWNSVALFNMLLNVQVGSVLGWKHVQIYVLSISVDSGVYSSGALTLCILLKYLN